jgi:Na+-translocating ferredoxin:NAD+ oxidoreductase RnfE subunit
MVSSKVSDASVLYGACLPLLGIGLYLPLIECGSMRAALVLGLTGALALLPAVIVIARLAPGLPRNSRIGLGAFIGAGMTILAGMGVSLLRFVETMPFSAVMPFVISAAVLIADAPVPQLKKSMTRSAVEALITGLGFAALLCVFGFLRGLIENPGYRNPGSLSLNPVHFLATVPGALILLALAAFIADAALARWKGEER